MWQRKFSEMSSQIYLKGKSNSFSAYFYSGIRSIERNVKNGAYYYRSIFAWFMTMRKEQILARAIEIQKENWG